MPTIIQTEVLVLSLSPSYFFSTLSEASWDSNKLLGFCDPLGSPLSLLKGFLMLPHSKSHNFLLVVCLSGCQLLICGHPYVVEQKLTCWALFCYPSLLVQLYTSLYVYFHCFHLHWRCFPSRRHLDYCSPESLLAEALVQMDFLLSLKSSLISQGHYK